MDVQVGTISPAVLDTTVFAPVPPDRSGAFAVSTRTGNRLVRTGTGHIRVREVGKGAGTVVLLPDAPNTLEHYDPIVELLRNDVRVLVLEIPGFGFSWTDDPAGLTFLGTVGAVIEVLDAVRVSQAVLAGICVQAHVALAVATARPDLVRALVLSQAASWDDMTRWSEQVLDPSGRLRTPWEGQVSWRRSRERTGIPGWYAAAARPGTDVSAWRDLAVRVHRAGATNSLATLLQSWTADPPDKLGPVSMPTTFLWGQADRTHRAAATRPNGLADVVPHARTETWTDAAHFLDIEHPKRFVGELRAVLG